MEILSLFSVFSLLFVYIWLTALVSAASQIGMLIALCVIPLRSKRPLF